jgi:hypothetical protein
LVSIRLSVRDMSEDRNLPTIDVRLPRNGLLEQMGPLVEAVMAQLGQVNWGPKESR